MQIARRSFKKYRADRRTSLQAEVINNVLRDDRAFAGRGTIHQQRLAREPITTLQPADSIGR